MVSWSTVSGVLLSLVHGIVSMSARGGSACDVLQRAVDVGHLQAKVYKLGVCAVLLSLQIYKTAARGVRIRMDCIQLFV